MDIVRHNQRAALRYRGQNRYIYLGANDENYDRTEHGQGDGPSSNFRRDPGLNADVYFMVMRQVARDFAEVENQIRLKMMRREETILQDQVLWDILATAFAMLFLTMIWLGYYLLWPRTLLSPFAPIYTVVFIAHWAVARSFLETKSSCALQKRMDPIQRLLSRKRSEITRAIENVFF